MIIRVILIIVFIYLLLGFVIVQLGKSFDTDNADYLIILGHKLSNNKPDEVLLNRLRKALEYIDENEQCNIVLSGGITSNNTISEAQIMRTYLIKNGVNSNRIILEDKSIDTVENIRNSCNYILPDKKIAILSSSYHTLRARMICKECGLNVKTIQAKTPLFELIKHTIIEIIFIPVNYFRLKKARH